MCHPQSEIQLRPWNQLHSIISVFRINSIITKNGKNETREKLHLHPQMFPEFQIHKKHVRYPVLGTSLFNILQLKNEFMPNICAHDTNQYLTKLKKNMESLWVYVAYICIKESTDLPLVIPIWSVCGSASLLSFYWNNCGSRRTSRTTSWARSHLDMPSYRRPL